MKLTFRTKVHMTDRKIVEYLIAGKSRRAICRELGTGHRRVRKVEELAREAGYLDGQVPLPAFPEALFEDAIRIPSQPSEAEASLVPYKAWIEERLQAGWHKVSIYEEIVKQVPVGRSSFYRFLQRFKLGLDGKSSRVVPEIVHLPGEALQLDWGLLCTVTCAETGQRRKVWALAGVLGYSRVMTVRLVWTNSVEVTMAAIEDMLIELGGVPKRVTSDNPKCFALAASTFEPLLNPAFEMLASHYDFAIECLPPADPKKKGKIERLMPFIRRLYESHGEWSGIEEAEAFLRGKVIIANDRKHGTTGEKPSERFEKEEKGALKPLPPLRYENHEIAEPIVRKDGHVRFKGKYYSVGDGLKGSSVVVLGNARIVRIYLKGKLLCVHDRITNRAVSKSTKDEHKKPWERTFAENSHLIKSAHSIGPSVGAFVANILKEQHGFVETRIVWGVIKLAEKYSKQDLNDACAMAMESHTYSYLYVKRILDSTSKAIKEEKKQPHTFIRSMDEYTSIIKRNGAKNERYSTSGATSQPSPIDSRAGASGTSHNSEARSSDGLGGLTP